MIDPLLLSSVKVLTFNSGQPLTNASGFLFERGYRLFLVTSRHVVRDEDSQHFPDLVRIALHTCLWRIAIQAAAQLRAIGDEVTLQYGEIAHPEIVAIILDQARLQEL
ncbi:MAG: hypothetical protein PVH89_11850 [Gammaproteobacteria bacterium]|jgi:hypothetical protein